MKKTSTLCVASRQAGRCGDCRHANQGTVDFGERKVFCGFGGQRGVDQPCDRPVELTREVGTTPERYFLFERFDGLNGTWGALEHTRVLAEDAGERQRAALRADTPVFEVETGPRPR